VSDTTTIAIPAVRPIDGAARAAAEARQAQLLKPPGSLGRLEEVAAWVAGVTGRARPGVPRTRVVIAAADHGVVGEGVSAFPQEVTGQMLGAFGAGWAAITVLARHAGADVVLVDAGVIAPPEGVASIDLGLSPSRNLAVEPALGEDEVRSALRAGRELAARAASDGVDLLIAGEMGIGNTTPAACLTATLCGLDAEAVVGRGTGVDDAGLRRKREVIARALALHGRHIDHPLEALRRLGGGELAVLTGLALGAGEHGLGLICDGVIATAAIAVAAELAPELKPRLLAGHRSVEPAHEHLLSRLGLRPLVELDLRLGEGSGAATALLLVDAACRLHDEMATFAEAGVAGA
jgi:nicotinate-nucleotide--dimethylbenzimidazole phosphoribosyltransferase